LTSSREIPAPLAAKLASLHGVRRLR
jgi:hypothetical protein